MSRTSKSVQQALQRIRYGERDIELLHTTTGVQPEIIQQMIDKWDAHLRNMADRRPEW